MRKNPLLENHNLKPIEIYNFYDILFKFSNVYFSKPLTEILAEKDVTLIIQD